MDYELINNNNSILIKDYECSETGTETARVLSAGKHHLEFRFGGDVEYAHNDAAMLEIYTGTGSTAAANPVTITFTTNMLSTNYAILLTGQQDNDAPFALEFGSKATTGFTVKIEDDGGANEAAGFEWAAIEYGENNFSGNLIKCNYGGTASTQTITFGSAFPNTNYAVVASPPTDTDSPRISYTAKATGSFDIRIEDDADNLGPAGGNIDWCAFSYGAYNISGVEIKAGYNTTTEATAKTIGLGSSFSDTNYVVIAMASMAGLTDDPCEIEVSNKQVNSFDITAEDDDITNNCGGREFNWVAIKQGYFSVDRTSPNVTKT